MRSHPPANVALAAEARKACELGAAHLLALRSDGVRWVMPDDLNALSGAGHFFMLRTTGLVEAPGALQDERRVAIHVLSQANPDGGYPKSPAGPSNRHVTRAVAKGLRLVLGEVKPVGRPAEWYRKNPELGPALEVPLRKAAERAESWCAAARRGPLLRFDEQEPLARLLVGYVDPVDPYGGALPVPPEWVAAAMQSDALQGLGVHLNQMLRRAVPWVVILWAGARRRRRSTGATWSPARRDALDFLAGRLQATQNPNGSWLYNAGYTYTALMALCEAGLSLNSNPVRRAHLYLRGCLCEAPEGGLSVNIVDKDVWDTALAVNAHIEHAALLGGVAALRPSVEWLLEQQCADGGFAWGSGACCDADADTTAVVGLALSAVRRGAVPELGAQLDRGLARMLAYVHGAQQPCGGFSAWPGNFRRARPGPCGVLGQVLFDRPTAALTGRVLDFMAAAGLTIESQAVRRCVRFLLRTRCSNGSWWSRWWAGYVPGAGCVAPALARLCATVPGRRRADQALVAGMRRAVNAAVRFLVVHQNADGGWGETTAADTDPRTAGAGDSRPLQTALAVSTLLRCGFPAGHSTVQRGVRYLLDVRTHEGTWEDDQETFTFISGYLYYPYPFLNHILPLNALACFCRAAGLDAGVWKG
jgi:squalene cyclase